MAPAYSKIVRSGITDIGSNNTTPAMPPNVTEGGPAPAGGFFDNPVVYRVMAFVFIASVGLVKRKVLKKLFLILRDKGKIWWAGSGQPASTVAAAHQSHEMMTMGTHAVSGGPTAPASAHLAGATRENHAQPYGGLRRAGTVSGGPTAPAPAHLAGTTRENHDQPRGLRRAGAVRHHRHQQQDEVQRAERGYHEVMKDDDEGDEVLEDVEDAEEDIADYISNC